MHLTKGTLSSHTLPLQHCSRGTATLRTNAPLLHTLVNSCTMVKLYGLLVGFLCLTSTLAVKTRRYFVAAEEKDWDFCPTGLNNFDGSKIDAPGSDSGLCFLFAKSAMIVQHLELNNRRLHVIICSFAATVSLDMSPWFTEHACSFLLIGN
jgi:hypothetical protein